MSDRAQINGSFLHLGGSTAKPPCKLRQGLLREDFPEKNTLFLSSAPITPHPHLANALKNCFFFWEAFLSDKTKMFCFDPNYLKTSSCSVTTMPAKLSSAKSIRRRPTWISILSQDADHWDFNFHVNHLVLPRFSSKLHRMHNHLHNFQLTTLVDIDTPLHNVLFG